MQIYLKFARVHTHKSAAATKNMPTIPIVSITKLTIDLSIIVSFFNSGAKLHLQKDTTSPKRQKNIKKMHFLPNISIFTSIR